MNDYLVRWLAAVTAMIVLGVVWTLCRALHRERAVTVVTTVIGAVAVVALGLAAAAHVTAPDTRDSALIAALSPATATATVDDATYLMRFHDPVALGGIGFGLMLELERHGRHIVADHWLRAAVLPQRTVAESDIIREVDSVLYVVSGEPAIESTMSLPGAELVVAADPRDTDEVERSAELRATIDSALIAAGRGDLVERLDEQYGVSQVMNELGLDAPLLVALEDYRDLRLPTAVVLVPVESVL